MKKIAYYISIMAAAASIMLAGAAEDSDKAGMAFVFVAAFAVFAIVAGKLHEDKYDDNIK